MRLIHTTTLQLADFWDGDVPPYAILSHTWGKEEITYLEMQFPTDEIKRKAGFIKIQRCADIAKSKGCSYIWVDTCCIDKSSSAELSEAINSMYQWYKQSRVCIAYLPDVPSGNKEEIQKQHFKSCRWVTRGWTLQELIAPRTVFFYGQDFNYIGDKRSLRWILSAATGIFLGVLESCDPSSVTVAKRMGWASKRKTTRIEDMAYCLMGIFNINMPLLYGEGGNAFVRLQEEIMKSSDDHTLFAWRAQVDSRSCYRGLLALRPREFHYELSNDSLDILSSKNYDDVPYTVTNKGVCMTIPLAPWREIRSDLLGDETLRSQFGYIEQHAEHSELSGSFEDDNFFVAILNVVSRDGDPISKGVAVGVILVRLPEKNQYARADAHLLVPCLDPEKFGLKTVYVRQNIQLARDYHCPRLSAFHISYTTASNQFDWNISASSLGKPLQFDEGKSENEYQLCSLNSQDGISKVLILCLESTDRSVTKGVAYVMLGWESQSGAYFCRCFSDQNREALDDFLRESSAGQVVSIKQKGDVIPLGERMGAFLYVTMYARLIDDRLVIAVDIETI